MLTIDELANSEECPCEICTGKAQREDNCQFRGNLLTDDEIQEFKKVALEVYGVKLTDAEALNQGSRLIQLCDLLVKRGRSSQDSVNHDRKMVQHE